MLTLWTGNAIPNTASEEQRQALIHASHAELITAVDSINKKNVPHTILTLLAKLRSHQATPESIIDLVKPALKQAAKSLHIHAILALLTAGSTTKEKSELMLGENNILSILESALNECRNLNEKKNNDKTRDKLIIDLRSGLNQLIHYGVIEQTPWIAALKTTEESRDFRIKSRLPLLLSYMQDQKKDKLSILECLSINNRINQKNSERKKPENKTSEEKKQTHRSIVK